MIPLISTGRSEPWKVGIIGSNRSEEHTSELQSRKDLVCRLLLEKKNQVIMLTCPQYRRTHGRPKASLSVATASSSVLFVRFALPNRCGTCELCYLFFFNWSGPPELLPLSPPPLSPD